MANTERPPLMAGLRALAADYRAILCDIWGVIHDGVRAFPAATTALTEFRAGGGKVTLITNAPRPRAAVVTQLDHLGVPRSAYDAIVSSGEVARGMLANAGSAKVHHVGPDRDLSIYEGLLLTLTSEEQCDLICCTGLVDDTVETPDDYVESIRRWRARELPMLCANPDIVVERGDQLVWCAGAIAERYREAGGNPTVVGKPYAAIYEAAIRSFAGQGPILAVGDGINTDVRGAFSQGIDVVFVTGGIHAAEFGDRERPDVKAVHAFLAEAGVGARALMARLVP